MTILQMMLSRYLRYTVLLFLVTLGLSGCTSGMFDEELSLLRPNFMKDSSNTDAPRPKPKAVVQVQTERGQPDALNGGGLSKLPPMESNIPSKELLPRYPGIPSPGLAPGAPPSPVHLIGRDATSPEQLSATAAGVVRNAPVKTAVPPRQRAVTGTPDISCGTQLLTEDSVWHGEVLVTGVVTVAPQATLTIEPGTVVRFAGADSPSSAGSGGELLVQGRLVASGTKNGPIFLTSLYAEPMRGDWQGIVLLGSEKKNTLEECTLEGAEIGIDASYSTLTLRGTRFVRCGTGIRLQDTVFSSGGGSVVNCEVGIALLDSEAELIDGSFSGNSRGVVSDRSSLYLSGGSFTRNNVVGLTADHSRVKISGGSFSNNGSGLLLVSSQGSVSGNTIAENADCGIALTDSRIRIQGNRIMRNRKTGLRVADGLGLAWGNSFIDNGGYDLVNDGREEFRAIANWWGASAGAGIERRIFDRQSDGRRGRVIYYPPLTEKPTL
jgi:parallel beta-helix repeat protein